jgi:hypothetical protein
VHLNDLLGDGDTKTGAALGPRVGVVDLLELLEDARGPVSDTLTLKWPSISLAVMRML